MASLIYLVILVAVLIVVIVALRNGQAGAGTPGFPYQPAKTLFSPAERSFLGVLDQAVGPEHRVFGKVRVADVAKVKSGLDNSARQGALNRIASKHFDFVVCRASDLGVVCAVELNDKSHASKRAQARDALLAGVCQAIDLPLLVVGAKQAYSLRDVRLQFLAAIASPQLAAGDAATPGVLTGESQRSATGGAADTPA